MLDEIVEKTKERVEIAKLLLEEFEDCQFIITALNKTSVDELEDLCTEYEKDNVVYEIEDWSLQEGPIISQR